MSLPLPPLPPQYSVHVNPRMLVVAKAVARKVKLPASYTVPGTQTTYTLSDTPKIKVIASR